MARIEHRENSLTTAAWMGDFGSRDHLIPGGVRVDPAGWAAVDHTITLSEAVTADDEVINVEGITASIPAGTTLSFGLIDVVTTSPVAIGATSIPIEPAPDAILAAATATFNVPAGAPVTIVSGTSIGRTIAERDAGTAFGPAAATDDEIFLVVNDIFDVNRNADAEVYRYNSIVKENFLPEVMAGTMIAGVLTKLRALYICVVGEA